MFQICAVQTCLEGGLPCDKLQIVIWSLQLIKTKTIEISFSVTEIKLK